MQSLLLCTNTPVHGERERGRDRERERNKFEKVKDEKEKVILVEVERTKAPRSCTKYLQGISKSNRSNCN